MTILPQLMAAKRAGWRSERLQQDLEMVAHEEQLPMHAASSRSAVEDVQLEGEGVERRPAQVRRDPRFPSSSGGEGGGLLKLMTERSAPLLAFL